MLPPNKLVLDNNRRWDSTFIMLSTAYTYRKCFTEFGEEDQAFTMYVPSEQDWEEVHEVCEFLEASYNVTNLISGSDYPTVNLFLLELSQIKSLINAQLDPSGKKNICNLWHLEWRLSMTSIGDIVIYCCLLGQCWILDTRRP